MKLEEALQIVEESSNNLMVVDVESTCWDSKKEQGSQKNEIIQVGFCPIRNSKVGEKSAIFVKPEYSKVSNFCTRLTSITKKEIDAKGFNYKEAYSRIKNIFSGFNIWASYGAYDKKQFLRMFDLYKIENFLPSKHINLRELFASKILNSSNAYDAPTNPFNAMKKINMPFIGRNHRGEDDAFNLARLYVKLMAEK